MARASGAAVRTVAWQGAESVPATRMPDQAAGLRHMLDVRPLPRVRILPVAGAGHCGQGAVVAALAHHASAAERVLVLDQSANEVARHAGVRPQHDLFDLVSGRHDFAQVVVRAGNWRLLAARRGLRQLAAAGAAIDDVYSAFLRLRDPVSLLLVNIDEDDAQVRVPGSGGDVLLVTAPGNDALTSAYARIKQWASDGPGVPDLRTTGAPRPQGSVRVLVNGADSYADARRVFRALAETARNFLEVDLAYAGFLPADRRGQPFGCCGRAVQPGCDAALARLATGLHGWRLAEYGLPDNSPSASGGARRASGSASTSPQPAAARYRETAFSATPVHHFEQGV